MEKYLLPPPASAGAALPLPRLPLQDASFRINQSPVKLAPLKSAQGEPPKKNFAVFHKQANSLLAAINNPAGGLTSSEEDKAFDLLQAAYHRAAAAGQVYPTPTMATPAQAAPAQAAPAQAAPAQAAPAQAAPTQAAPAQAAPAKAAGSKKRKSAPETSLAEDIAAYKQKLDIETDAFYIDMGCAKVRKLINQVLDTGIMKKGEFCDAIGSSNRSVNTFLQKTGMDGGHTESYTNAWAWFKQREIAGLKMPDVKKRQKAEAAAASAGGSNAPNAGPAAKKSKTAVVSTALPELISQIHLDGEDTDSVPVFDSADEIRKKISAHLKTPGLTQAQFCRDLHAQLQKPTCKSIQSKMLNDFRGKKGAIAGCTSTVFYAAYVYFEKLRIAKGKPKTNHRTEMERVHGPTGMDREHDGRHGYLVFSGESVSIDSYGRFNVHR